MENKINYIIDDNEPDLISMSEEEYDIAHKAYMDKARRQSEELQKWIREFELSSKN